MSLRSYVFFDVDFTLVEWTTSWAGVFAEVAAEAGVTVTADQAWEVLRGAVADSYQECIEKYSATGDVQEFWLDYDGRLLAALGVKHDLRRRAQRVVDLLTQPGAIRLYPEVLPVLQKLAGLGARLGVVSGRPLARPDLERLGIGEYFDPVIDAFHAGSPKSAGRMFTMAAEAAAAAGRQAWHVGDSYADDVQGARKAGIRPILVDRWSLYLDADCRRIPDLRGLPEMIAGDGEPA